jgi:dTDP-4-dehydrorhamnose 3,5-epimerase
MILKESTLAGVMQIELAAFEDHRGEYLETYNEVEYAKHGIKTRFIQDDISVSSRHVLRGIHGDNETWKLISCLRGSFYLVIVDCHHDSQHFGAWQAFTLTERNRLQILVPPGHGVAHLVLEDRSIFHYKQSTCYNRDGQFTYRWDDPAFNIWWPITNPILSKRDELGREIDKFTQRQ